MTTPVLSDLSELPKLLEDLYRTVKALEALAPGRRFTPDGHLVGSIGQAVAAYAYDLKLCRASTKAHDATAQDGRLVQIKLTQGKVIATSHNCEHLLVLKFDQKAGFTEIYNGPGSSVWDLVGTKAAAGRQRQISVARLRILQKSGGNAIPRTRDFPSVVPKALKAAGVEFIEDNGGGAGVRFMEARR